HHRILELNQIHNAAAIVAEVTTGNVIAYVGNTSPGGETLHENYVDVITAPRSSGSILKPFLYAAMLDDGLILPNSLVKDIPTWMGGFSPKNFNYQYDGVVPASMALSRSLNVPAVRMLQDFGHDRFCHLLQDLGFTTINRPADDYGLSVILGGAEVTLWDLASVYAGMARTLRKFYDRSGKYNVLEDFRKLNLMENDPSLLQDAAFEGNMSPNPLLSAGSVWLTLEALLKVNRPDEEVHWEQFSSSGKIAWKTGTSFGFRDAWAVGVTPDHVVAVWVGNADGEGRAGLSGVSSAAPIMFDLFRLLPSGRWFDPPYDELIRVPVCKLSGYRAGDYCGEADTAWVIASSLQLPSCPFHQIIHLDEIGKFRVHADCEEITRIKPIPWFVLPPAADKYYRMKNPAYKPLPPFRPDCLRKSGLAPMEFIYPGNGVNILIPREFGGSLGKAVFELAHRDVNAKVFWHLDDQYLGQTQGLHQIECSPQPGKHQITVYDQNGFSASSSFEVRGK
ncbi:MAG: penicillin-binding protein 1C, partial [Bacteroidetes bacterium]|nr:penicillin-binding protein 1C [Bacteroidota bacterium]